MLNMKSWRGRPVRWLMRSVIVLSADATGSMSFQVGIIDAILVFQEICGVRLVFDINRPVAKISKSCT
jgi:hypothetical protein